MCKILSKSGDPKEFEKLLSFLLNSMRKQRDEFESSPTINNYMLLQNYLIFFMVLTLNLKKFPSFIKIIFEGELEFFTNLKKLLFGMNSSRKKKKLIKLLYNIFLEEYKDYFFRQIMDEDLQNILITQQTEYSKEISDTINFYDEATYKKMFEILIDFNISYANFFQNKSDISEEEKPAYKLIVAQSLIRVIFSKEKKKYLQDANNFYEYDLLKKIIDKDMKETAEKFGDEYKTLFRKEDICDDVLKYMFFIFGNTMLIESFVKPLKTILGHIGITDELINKKDELAMTRDIKPEEFNELIDIVVGKLSEKLPGVLKILLKLLHISILDHFTIEKDNYGPLYTSLIFNFLISPRIQMLYSINPLNCIFVRSLNRIIRNTCFNTKFASGDPLEKFNEYMDRNHKKLHNLIQEQIINIKIDDSTKNKLKDLFTEQYLIYPKFLFYFDSDLLVNTIQGGAKEIIVFEELKSKDTVVNFDKIEEVKEE